MENENYKSVLSYLNEGTNYFLHEYLLSDCTSKPESVSEVDLKIRILNKNLISPVYPANSDHKAILNQLVIKHYSNVVDKEIEILKDDRVDRGCEELSDEEENIEKIKRQQAYLSDFEKNPAVLNLEEVWKSLGSIGNDSISLEGLSSFIHKNEFLERGYNSIIQFVLNTLTKNSIDFSYIYNDVNNRTLTIKEYFPSKENSDADESFQLIVTVEIDDKSGEHGVCFHLKMKFLKKYQLTPQKLMPCLNEIVQSISRQNADPAFTTFSRRRSTVRADIDSLFTEEFINPFEIKNEVSPVTCSVYAPAKAKRSETVMIQVFAHSPEKAEEADEMALTFDDSSSKRAQKRLSKAIEIGSTLHFSLSITGLEIDNSEEELIWNEETESVQFMVDIPATYSKSNLIGKVIVSQDSIPIGHMLFKMDIDEKKEIDEAYVKSEMKQYNHAFISYASDDRDEVLRRVQMLQSINISFFQDILDLNPGDNWEEELYRQIDKSDVFFLFWSISAKKSEWVMKEVDYALKRIAKENTPEIIPIILNAPPMVTPPENLKHIHFNDRLAYFIQKESSVKKDKKSRKPLGLMEL